MSKSPDFEERRLAGEEKNKNTNRHKGKGCGMKDFQSDFAGIDLEADGTVFLRAIMVSL